MTGRKSRSPVAAFLCATAVVMTGYFGPDYFAVASSVPEAEGGDDIEQEEEFSSSSREPTSSRTGLKDTYSADLHSQSSDSDAAAGGGGGNFYVDVNVRGDDGEALCRATARGPIIYGPGRQVLELDAFSRRLEEHAESAVDEPSSAQVHSSHDFPRFHHPDFPYHPDIPLQPSSSSTRQLQLPVPPPWSLSLTGKQALDAYKESRKSEISWLSLRGAPKKTLLTLQKLMPGDGGPDSAPPRWTSVEDLSAPLQDAPPPAGASHCAGSEELQLESSSADDHDEQQGIILRGVKNLWKRLRTRIMAPAAEVAVGSYRILPVIRLVNPVAGTVVYEHVIGWDRKEERDTSVVDVIRGYREAKRIPLSSTHVDVHVLSRDGDPAAPPVPLSGRMSAGEFSVMVMRKPLFRGATVAEHLDQLARMEETNDDSASMWVRLFGDETDEEEEALRKQLQNSHLSKADRGDVMAERLRSLMGRLLERSGLNVSRTAELNHKSWQYEDRTSSPITMYCDSYSNSGAAGTELGETSSCSAKYQRDAEGRTITASEAIDPPAVSDLLAAIGEIVHTQILKTNAQDGSSTDELAVDASVISTAKHLAPFSLIGNPRIYADAQYRLMGLGRPMREREAWKWTRTLLRWAKTPGGQNRELEFYEHEDDWDRVSGEMQRLLREELSFKSLLNPSQRAVRSRSGRATRPDWNARRVALTMTSSTSAGPTYILTISYGTTKNTSSLFAAPAADYTESPEIVFTYFFNHNPYSHVARRGRSLRAQREKCPRLPRLSGFALFVRPARNDRFPPGVGRIRDTTTTSTDGEEKPEVRVYWEPAGPEDYADDDERDWLIHQE